MRPVLPRVINKTGLRGDDLIHFTYAGVTARGAQGVVSVVEYRTSPSFRTTGLCWPLERRILLLIPRGFNPAVDLPEVAQVFTHELDHALGLDHIDMKDWWTLDVPWVKGLQLRPRLGTAVQQALREYERRIRVLVLEMDELQATHRSELRALRSTKRQRRTKKA